MQRKLFLRYLGAVSGSLAVGQMAAGCGGGSAELTATPNAAGAAPAAVAEALPGGNVAPAEAVDETMAPSTLSADEIAGLRFMREEEKLAHDVYIAMFSLWGHRTFSNIALSETEHTEAILALLIKYGVDDPAAAKPAGVFEDPELQALYDTLLAAGAPSLIAGLQVGALIEETDIQDIEERKAVTDAPDILAVYESLLCGSRNHLRAFDRALLALGVSYVAQVITQQEWDAIASAPMETCGR
jgi:hypothetical protein